MSFADRCHGRRQCGELKCCRIISLGSVIGSARYEIGFAAGDENQPVLKRSRGVPHPGSIGISKIVKDPSRVVEFRVGEDAVRRIVSANDEHLASTYQSCRVSAASEIESDSKKSESAARGIVEFRGVQCGLG